MVEKRPELSRSVWEWRFSGGLYKIGDNQFTYNGTPSVTISFDFQGGKVKSLTLTEPNITVTAQKVSA